MKRNRILAIGCWLLAVSFSAYAQKDSTLNRSVTVERDFQPVIQTAGKIATKPAIIELTLEPTDVEHTEYKADIKPEAVFNPLLSQPTRFGDRKGYNGYVTGAVGHPNSLFDFGYHLNDGKKSILDVYAHHRGEWGLATLSKSVLGLTYTHNYSNCDLYFGLNGGNIYYYKYGHWYDYTTPHGMWEKNSVAYNRQPLTDRDITSLWTAEAFIGVKANAKQELQYQAQTGYKIFSKPGAVNEHQIRTKAFVDWSSEEHHVGAKLYVQNNFLQLGSLATVIDDTLYRSRHNLRMEPYYEYEGTRVRVHVGVNLDVNFGRGQNELSATKNISFGPSPHLFLEAQIAKNWLTLYADVQGSHGLGSLQEYMEENRYRLIHAGIIEPHAASYTPVDAELGFRIRPYRDLLFEIHGGYAYMMHQDVWVANTDSASITIGGVNRKLMGQGDFSYLHTKYQRGKVGGQMYYHYQDIVRIALAGDYYFWYGSIPVYDRPNWEVHLRVDGKINENWSLYSDNHLAGSRLALAYNATTDTYTNQILRPTIDLNLGLQYDTWVNVGKKAKDAKTAKDGTQIVRPEPKPNLTFFFQLNNWLHRKNEYFYGYRSQGINFLAGVTFRF